MLGDDEAAGGTMAYSDGGACVGGCRWNAAFVFEVEDLYEPLEVKIFDQDLLGANDFLGQALVVVRFNNAHH